ncbi:MAG TPA: hypothetical protein VH641_14450 [Streptosporangiaceae bacterium]|jgi:hypothetical protein
MNLHEITETARHTSCSCGATPGQPCTCEPGGVHLSRVARARASHLLSAEDFASVIADHDVYAGSTVVLDPEAAA